MPSSSRLSSGVGSLSNLMKRQFSSAQCRNIQVELNAACHAEADIAAAIVGLSKDVKVSLRGRHGIWIQVPRTEPELFRAIMETIRACGCRVSRGKFD